MGSLWLYTVALSSVIFNVVLCVVPYDVGQTEIIHRLGETSSVKGTRWGVLGETVDAFLGIPFAKPPVGDLRFKRPEVYAGPSWSGVFDATKQPNSCPQALDNSFGRHPGVEMWNANTMLDEDCLYLNIWVPYPLRSEKFAVMIWIYGGSFMTGTSTLDVYDGRILAATHNVIVVSMQYRVGPLGFAYLGIDDVPGNVGLLDQQAAIQWTYNNIEKFGGDRNKITVFGESAGSASVSYHLLSRRSWPYFNRAILQSGSAAGHWAYQTPNMAKLQTIKLAKMLGCTTEGVTLETIARCLMGVDATKMVNEVWNMINMYFEVPIGPTMDGYFITEPPSESIKNKRIKNADLLTGGNADEGMYFLLYGLPNYFQLNNKTPLNREQFLLALDRVAPTNVTLVREAVIYKYEKSEVFSGASDKYRDMLDDVAGDTLFICPTVDFTQAAYSDKNQIYMYHFKHRSVNNPWPAWMGVLHGYEIEYVFGDPMNDTLNYTVQDRDISRRMMAYWTNFVKNGDPNIGTPVSTRWPRYTESGKEYFVLDNTPGRTENGLRHPFCSFWREFVPQIYSSIQRNRVYCSPSVSSGVLYSGTALLLAATVAVCHQLYSLD